MKHVLSYVVSPPTCIKVKDTIKVLYRMVGTPRILIHTNYLHQGFISIILSSMLYSHTYEILNIGRRFKLIVTLIHHV